MENENVCGKQSMSSGPSSMERFLQTHQEQRVYSMYKEQQIGEMTKLFALIKLFQRTFVEIFSF